jgi:hypothetical protein
MALNRIVLQRSVALRVFHSCRLSWTHPEGDEAARFADGALGLYGIIIDKPWIELDRKVV